MIDQLKKKPCISSDYLLVTKYSLIKQTGMEITGRVTRDAIVRTTKDKRKVVSFSLVVNDYYKTKEREIKQLSTFVDCSYWLSENIVKHLLKGSIVQVFGRIYVNAYKTKDGDMQASLAFHVNNIKIIAKPKALAGDDTKDDLPF
jgi:single-strand DNA-binding protein